MENNERKPDKQYDWCVEQYEDLRKQYNMEDAIRILAENVEAQVRYQLHMDEAEADEIPNDITEFGGNDYMFNPSVKPQFKEGKSGFGVYFTEGTVFSDESFNDDVFLSKMRPGSMDALPVLTEQEKNMYWEAEEEIMRIRRDTGSDITPHDNMC